MYCLSLMSCYLRWGEVGVVKPCNLLWLDLKQLRHSRMLPLLNQDDSVTIVYSEVYYNISHLHFFRTTQNYVILVPSNTLKDNNFLAVNVTL